MFLFLFRQFNEPPQLECSIPLKYKVTLREQAHKNTETHIATFGLKRPWGQYSKNLCTTRVISLSNFYV